MASGDLLAEWTALNGEPPSSTYATLVVVNNQPMLEFDDATDESVYFSGVLSDHYAGGGLTATLMWTSESATSNNCVWTCAVERQASAAAIGSDSFATAQTVTAVSPSVAGNLEYDTIAFTSGAQMDSLAANERFRLLITRDANNGSDTLVGDARLVHVALRET